ncbi:MAG: DUF2945 domain-containing protein [Bdellovibrionales bacterium]|nr:DUF2945 domain-containing protein [Bdellovibrionales bacterium]
MSEHFKVGDRVAWKWMGRLIEGQVEEVFFEKTSKTIKGKIITRNGSTKVPAYLVKSEAGNLALKLQSELQKPESTSKSRRPRPRMFE